MFLVLFKGEFEPPKRNNVFLKPSPVSADCFDVADDCEDRAALGECHDNWELMSQECRRSCYMCSQVVHVGGECWLGRAQGCWDGGEGATGGPCGR